MKKLAKILAFVIAAVAVLPFMKGLPVHAAGDIKIDKSHFPDDNFRSVIRTAAYDSDLNGYLSLSERNNVINIHCESSNIYSVEGIKYFPNVEGLWCLDNHISSWDLSQNTHLKGIWCSQNDFTTLDFSNNKELEWLYCFKCSKLTSLNVSENTELAYLECNANPKLTSLNLKNNKKLENLFCSDCNLKSLNLSGNKLLCELDAFNNKLTYINLSNNTKLKRLDVWNNPNLGNVNVSKLKELEFYNCAETGATKVDVTNNPELQMLVCSYNEDLTSLDLSHNPRLAVLHLDCDWKLTSLDLSHNPKLYYLQAFGLRGISKLDISNNSRLIKAYKEGVYQDEPKLGEVHSYTINYGGSGEYFDNLLHCLVVDNDVTIVTTGSTSSNVNDSFIDTNDGHSNSESFATREEAVMLLYQKAGSPAVRGNSTFKDVSSSASYAKAVKWAQDNNICFGYPDICSDTFGVGKQISRQDFALMAHRFAGYMKLGTSFDYGRTDWFYDFKNIDYYAWGAFTWAIQWEVLNTKDNYCYPRGRVTKNELKAGVDKIFNIDEAASYSMRVNTNGTLPEITSHPVDYTGKAGEYATFKVEAEGMYLRYQWQFNNGSGWLNSNSTGSDTPSMSIKITDKRNGQRYRCVVMDMYDNKVISNSAKIIVEQPKGFEITSQPCDFTGLAGSTANFTVEANGEGMTYKWQYNSGSGWHASSMTGYNTNTLTVKITDARDGQMYRCVITDIDGYKVASDPAKLTVAQPEGPVITKQPVDFTGSVGMTATFNVTAEGEGLTYQWQFSKNGRTWTNSTASGYDTASMSIKIKDERIGQQYRCIITDIDGNSTTSAVATIIAG